MQKIAGGETGRGKWKIQAGNKWERKIHKVLKHLVETNEEKQTLVPKGVNLKAQIEHLNKVNDERDKVTAELKRETEELCKKP